MEAIERLILEYKEKTKSVVNYDMHTYYVSTFHSTAIEGSSGVYAGKRQFPDANKIPTLLNKLIRDVNAEIRLIQTVEEKLKLSFKIHFEFVSIHPFGDENGRVSRLLMNYIQQYFDLPISVVSKSARIKYFDALESSRKTESLDSFYKFMFSEYRKFLKKELR